MRLIPYLLFLLATASSAAAQENPAELAGTAGCSNCHQAEQQTVGPAWQAIAERYGDEEDAAQTLHERMRAGVQGVWGRIPMAPVTPEQLNDEQLSVVLDWILSR